MSLILNTLPFVVSALLLILALRRCLPTLKFQQDDISIPSTSLYKSSSSSTLRQLLSSKSGKSHLILLRLIVNISVYTTVTASGVIVELVLCEICNWLNSDARVLVWKVCTTVLLTMLVIVIPILEAFIWFSSSPSLLIAKFKLPLTFAAFFSWLVIFQQLGKYIPLPPPEPPSTVAAAFSLNAWYHVTTRSFTEETLSRNVVIGVCAMAVLSGFAAVSTPYTVFFSKSKQVTMLDLELLTNSIETTTQLVTSKTAEFNAIQARIKDRRILSSVNLRAKILSSIRAATGFSDGLTQEYNTLEMELGALSKMHNELHSELRDFQAAYSAQLSRKTPLGNIIQKAYVIFAFYCIYRLVNVLLLRNPISRARVLISMLHHTYSSVPELSEKHSDALAITIARIAVQFSTYSNVEAWTRQISFILSGFLFIGSISSALTTFNSLAKAFPFLKQELFNLYSPNSDCQGLGLLIASQVSAIYILSTSLLLRSNLPNEMSSAITAALGAPLDTYFVESLFETSFAIAAIVSLVCIWLAHRHHQEDQIIYDEENLLDYNGKLA